MFFTEILISSWRALNVNKIRTFLTMLGVVIGVFAVIALVSVVKGVENNITGQFNSLGSRLVIVAPGRAKFTQDPALSFTSNKLEISQLDTIKSGASDYIVGVVPNIRVGMTMKYKTKSFFASLVGTSDEALSIVNLKLQEGRFFNQIEVQSSSRVVIIGPEIKKSLFSNTEAIDKEVKIDNKTFTVIGVLDAEGFGSDDRAIVPYTTMKNSLGIKRISGFSAKVKDEVEIDTAVREITIALLDDLETDDFTVLTQRDILNSIQSILNVISIGLSAIAGISLLVGGIGIMNIMLVSVNERVREIGLRKALGATSRMIAIQFLLESMIISLGGGLVGISMGYGLTFILRNYFPAQVPLWTLLLSFSFSLVVGLLFGTYPAIKASRKDPIESLRYE